jgi:hypothetical protein
MIKKIWYAEKAMFGLTEEETVCFLKYFPPGMKNFVERSIYFFERLQ